jgi:hypothetical protein
MRQTLCLRFGLVATILLLLQLLGGPAQTAHAQSKIRKRLVRYDWVGNGHSRGNSPLSLELKFTRKAKTAFLSVYWPRYRKFTARREKVKVRTLASGKGLKIKDRFSDGHPIYKYKSSTGIYCHIPARDFLRSNQFRCKVQYSGWILMHRKGVAVRRMASNPPARPPSLKKHPPARPSGAKRSGGRSKTSIVGCWMKSITRSGAHRKVHSLRFTKKGRFRWIPARRPRTTRGVYVISGSDLLLLNHKRTRGTRWRFTVTRCIPRRPHQPCLRLQKPQSIRRSRRGKITRRGRVGTQSHLFMHVGTHPNCR